MDKYKVTYSRKMAGGKRLIAYNQIVNKQDFLIIANDVSSRYEYILIKAELLDYDVLELDSVNYGTTED